MKVIELDSIQNIRDFGGTKTLDGKIIRSKRFIRSGSLNGLSKADLKILKEKYNLKTVIDLRTNTEVEEAPDALSKDIDYCHISLLDRSVVGITHEVETQASRSLPNMGKLYRNIVVKDHSVKALKEVMIKISEASENGAVLWHCSEGKDRCGIVSALFLSMMNVDRYTIYDDYMTTNDTAAKKAQKQYWITLLRMHSVDAARSIKESLLADERYLQAAFDAIDEKYGGTENFFKIIMEIDPEIMSSLKSRALKERKVTSE